VNSGVKGFHPIAVSFEQNARAFRSGAPYRDNQVDQEDNHGPRAEMYGAESPTGESITENPLYMGSPLGIQARQSGRVQSMWLVLGVNSDFALVISRRRGQTVQFRARGSPLLIDRCSLPERKKPVPSSIDGALEPTVHGRCIESREDVDFALLTITSVVELGGWHAPHPGQGQCNYPLIGVNRHDMVYGTPEFVSLEILRP
jgi:hypothetical protein